PRLELEQALQTYPHWKHLDCSEPPVVLKPLDEGLTNDCYLIQAGGERCILRLNALNSRAMGLDRVNEQVALRKAEKASLGPSVVYCAPNQGMLVTKYIEGKHWSPAEAKTERNIERLAQLLKQVHALPGIGKYLIPKDVTDRYLRGIKAQFLIIPQRFQALEETMNRLMHESTRHFTTRRLCHNDPVLGNIIDSGEQLFLIDWEYAAMGDPLFDLAVAVHNLKLNETQLQQLLTCYLGSPVDLATHRCFLNNYAIYMYIDMLWYWFQSAYSPGNGFSAIAESKLDTLVAILHELGVS
ncbi:MAG: phosphotransferase family protein, partial [Pseudomonadales bacterium]|nr:phosphotransferase family protein [Pseudomonadales bacterium]